MRGSGRSSATATCGSCRSAPAARTSSPLAALTNELTHFNGRTGMGAVMGSKNLKAIAVRGKSPYIRGVCDPAPVAELGKSLARRVKDHPLAWDLQSKGADRSRRRAQCGRDAAHAELSRRRLRRGRQHQLADLREGDLLGEAHLLLVLDPLQA